MIFELYIVFVGPELRWEIHTKAAHRELNYRVLPNKVKATSFFFFSFFLGFHRFLESEIRVPSFLATNPLQTDSLGGKLNGIGKTTWQKKKKKFH